MRRNNPIALKILGILMAITGSWIILHTVPLVVWYGALILLILALVFMLFFSP